MIAKIKTYLQNNQEIKKVAQSISWLFFDQIVRYSLALLIGVWMARSLGSDNFGVYNYTFAFFSIFGILAGLGIRQVFIRELVKTPEKELVLIGSSFFLLLGAGVLAFLLSVLSVYLLRPNDIMAISMVAFMCIGFVFQAFSVIPWSFEARTEVKYIIRLSQISLWLTNFFKAYCLWQNLGLESFAVAVSLEIFINIFLYIYAYQQYRGLSLRQWEWDKAVAKNILRGSLPLLLSGMMVILYIKIDQIMIRDLCNDHEAGLYAAAVRLTEIWYFVPMIIQNAVFPNIFQSFENKPLFYQKMYKFCSIMVLFSYAVAIPTTFLSEWVLVLLFGEEYRAAGLLLSLSIWAVLFASLGVVRGVYLVSNNYMKVSFIFTFVGLIINVTLNYLFLPLYGGVAAAIATLIAYSVAGYWTGFFYAPTRKITNIMTKAIFFPSIRNIKNIED